VCTVQQILDEEKSKHDLAQQNGFGLAFFTRMLRLAKVTVAQASKSDST
jgi:hypothetical protein